MASVGILTMHRIVNYGSFLQAYALKTMLEEMGHDVQFVDYRTGTPLIKSEKKQKKGLSRKLDKAFEALRYDAPFWHKIKFVLYKKQFAGKYHKLLGLNSTPNYTPKLDVLIIGSDEVFNCVQENPNVGYSLELFGANNKAKKLITYAASFGNTTFEKLERYGKSAEIGQKLSRFDRLSVRDNNSSSIVKRLIDREAEIHLDPVLIYDFISECKKLPRIEPKEKYLILYAYPGRITEKESDWISSYAKKKGLKVYAIGGIQKCADQFLACSPFEVLSYFQKAEEVITDTFHGSIFSIITQRSFVVLVRKSIDDSYGNEEKLTDLLIRLKLAERIAYSEEAISSVLETKIDYVTVNQILKAEREKARAYLLNETQEA